MLCQFTIKNFKSFREEATLDLCAENISEHKTSLIVSKEDRECFLPVAVIYGPNGSGKTSVLEAFAYVYRKIIGPIIALSEKQDTSDINDVINSNLLQINEKQKFFKFEPKCESLPTEFTIISRINGLEYNYSLGIVGDIISFENLYVMDIKSGEPDVIFEREYDGHNTKSVLGDELNGISTEKISKKITFLSHFAVTSDIEVIDTFIDWLMHCSILNYDNPIADRSFIPSELKNNKKTIIKLLNDMDINIVDIRIENNDDGSIKEIYTSHLLQDGSCSELTLVDESSGTRKVFSFLPEILIALKDGSVVIADELDAKLHPKLFGYILNLFTNPDINKNHAQLICTSHDITNMNKETFRRDEIWFCALNSNNESHLYSLVQFKMPDGTMPRKDGSYAKQYIKGRYGADPYIKRILEWK